jgi:hypothetical protein
VIRIAITEVASSVGLKKQNFGRSEQDTLHRTGPSIDAMVNS